jgi:proteic killer suppression protein
VIKSFRHKGLSEAFDTGRSSKVPAELLKRTLVRLDALHQAATLADLGLPGFNTHPLKGFKPTRYSIHVNGPWCITFEWDDKEGAKAVDLEQYH